MKEVFLNTLLKSLYGIMILLGAVIVKAYYFFFWIIFWEGKLYIDSREWFLKYQDIVPAF